MFSKAIVRKPGRSMVYGLSTSSLDPLDYYEALTQHEAYMKSLSYCGLDIIILEEDENYPDSCFVEDTALLTPYCAIIMNPCPISRKGEVVEIRKVLRQFFSDIEEIKDPGTVEGGDILMVDNHYYIGLSERTNKYGAAQVIKILRKHKMSASTINMKKGLHLKSSLAYLENNNLVIYGDIIADPAFEKFNKIQIPNYEGYAANCLWLNQKVLVPKNYPATMKLIADLGYEVVELEMSEFRKLDGGLSCLSLRF